MKKAIGWGLVLYVVNVISLFVGLMIANATGQKYALVPRITISVLATIVLFAAIRAPMKSRPGQKIWTDGAAIVIASMLWHLIIFVPTHYASQGYLTSFGNIYKVWAVQLIANSLAVAAARMAHPTKGAI